MLRDRVFVVFNNPLTLLLCVAVAVFVCLTIILVAPTDIYSSGTGKAESSYSTKSDSYLKLPISKILENGQDCRRNV